ncbi:uncharacterized protein LOC142612169 [Castanea sativa]|uniref:uncharacterized protein LOC142612169 n=1 Tax=Castanea sativa TaxID=21020 RepID=UPI003F653E52
MEKIAFALVVASRKLRPYFQAHSIVVITDQPIIKKMNKIDAIGGLIQWAIKLGQFDIKYQPRAAIKAQVLANFITEFTYPCKEEELLMETWTVQIDGSATKKVGRTGVVLISPKKEILNYAVRLQFSTMNNEAKYEALLIGLSLAKALRAKNLIIQVDSQLVIGQAKGDYEAKEERMSRKKQLRFLIVAVDYFTKWVEAKLVATITEAKITSFVWKNIICKFGVPRIILSDNGKQFDNPKFRKFFQDLGIKNHYSSPRHPQANGQTKVMNRSLLKIIKTQLKGPKGAWSKELPNVLWAYRITARVPIGETPFRLTFGIKAVIPMEVGLTSLQVKTYEGQKNQQELNSNLDLIDKVRKEAEK